MRRRILVSLLALLMVSAAGLAAADGHDASGDDEEQDDQDEATGSTEDQDDEAEEDGRDDEAEEDERDGSGHQAEAERREVEVEADDDGVSFELKRESASSEDKLEATFDFEDAAFEVKYEAEEGDNETESKLEAEFQTILEYRDSDGDGKYSSGDEVVSAYALGDESEDFELDGRADWQSPTLMDISEDNKTGKRIDAPARIGDNGTFELRFYVFGDFVDLGNASLEPTSIKVDIIIEGYPYLANDTALALILETESKQETERDHESLRDDEEGVAAPVGRGVSLVFSWKTHAAVDGVSTEVKTTSFGVKEEAESDEDGSERKVEERFALSYERGGRIVHDPESRLSVQSSDAETVGVPGIGIAVLAAALAGVGVFVRRH